MATVSIAGLDPVSVLLALYKAAKPAENRVMAEKDELTPEHARVMIDSCKRCSSTIWFVHGKVIAADFSKEVINQTIYDEANGAELVQKVIVELRLK